MEKINKAKNWFFENLVLPGIYHFNKSVKKEREKTNIRNEEGVTTIDP